MKEVLNKLFKYQSLSKDEAFTILSNLATGQYNNSQMAAFMTVYLMALIYSTAKLNLPSCLSEI